MEENKEINLFAISDVQLNEIFAVLETMPYNKVYGIIESIKKVPKIEIQAPKEERPDLDNANS